MGGLVERGKRGTRAVNVRSYHRPLAIGSVSSGCDSILLEAVGYSGGDSFTYRVCDDQGACATASVTISVNGAPLVLDDVAGALSGAATDVDVLANDSDPDGSLDVTSVAIVSGPIHGSASVDPVTGLISYTSTPGYFGLDELTYRVCDTGSPALCASATLTVLVDAPPEAVDDAARTLRNNPVSIDVLANDSDPDGALLPASVAVVGGPAHGQVSVNATTGTITYTPNPGWYGDDSFDYRLCDQATPPGCSTATVQVHVNAPPNAVDDAAGTTVDTPVVISVLANDSDPDGSIDPVSVEIVAAPSHGTVSLDPVSGRITYAPDAGFHGTDSFTYRVCDVDVPLGCDTAIVRIGLPPTDTLLPTEQKAGGSILVGGSLLAGLMALLIALAAPRRRRREHARR